jgi:DNA transformation protein
MRRTQGQQARQSGRLRSLRVSTGFKSFVLDQLEELGDVTPRSMFGGVGLYHRGVFFGIVARDTVYFKVGETNRADYKRARTKAFRPYPNRSGVMKYHAVPLEVLESAPELACWARKAIAVASRAALTLLLIACSSAAMRAQGPDTDHPWEIEVYAGSTMPHSPSGGKGGLPPAGAALPVNFAGAPTRAVSSWYIGDGAQLLNQALSSFRINQQLTPLDAVAQSAFARREPGSTFGVRLSRSLNAHFSAELSLDYTHANLALTGASLAGLEASRESFISAWNALLNLPLLAASRSVTSTATTRDHQGGEMGVAGTMSVNLLRSGPTRPYVTAGAGIVAQTGGLPSAELAGKYQFTITPLAPVPVAGLVFEETDTIAVRSSIGTTVVGIVGGGIKQFVTPRWGVRIDVRERIGRSTAITLLDATPRSGGTGGSAVGALSIGTTPPLVFSTSSTGARSNLSGAPISGFRTFAGSGITLQLNVTAGLIWRF